MQIQTDTNNIQSLITLIEAREEPEKIINFIRAYIFDTELAITN